MVKKKPMTLDEVPRIVQQFGLDSSVKVNMMSVVHTANTTVSLARTIKTLGGIQLMTCKFR